MLYISNVMEKPKTNTKLCIVTYGNDMQLKLIQRGAETFGGTLEVLGDKEDYDETLRVQARLKSVNYPSAAIGIAFILLIVLILVTIMFLMSGNNADPANMYR